MPPPLPFVSRQSCAICGQPMIVHQAVSGGICDRHPCRHQAALQAIAARKVKTRALLMADATRHRARAAAKLKLAGPHELPITLVPASTRRSTVLPASRRRQFRVHLETVFTRLAQTPAPSRATRPPDEHPHGARCHAEPRAVDAACATCRGYCCHGGGETAYIDEATLQHFAQAHPSLDHNDTVRAYVSHLPQRSMQDSCVFHGEQGCTLPGDMRSATCNNYHCDGLRKLLSIDVRQVLITAATDVDVVRYTVFANQHISTTFRPGSNAQAHLPARATPKTSRANER